MDDTYSIRVSRTMDVSPERVWDAWADPASIARWWGPAGFHSTVNELDLREGGRFDVVMHGPDGTDYPNVYVFDLVERPGRLAYTNQGSEEFGLEPFGSIVELQAEGDGTRVTLTARYASAEEKRRHVEDFHAVEGAEQLLARLEVEAAARG